MDLRDILLKIKNNETDLDAAEDLIRGMGYVPVSDIAKIDVCRSQRTGVMEAILAEGKEPEDVVKIAQAHVDACGRVLVTRLNEINVKLIEDAFRPEQLKWGKYKKTVVVHNGTPVPRTGGVVAIISAGTADITVAEEARIVASEMGCETIAIYDVGVAGFHRLVGEMLKLRSHKPDSIVVAAGREGTLPTVVSGLVDVPVIGVPVSTGYGAGAKGEAALLSMLQSCSVLAVVNIDAGFVAGAFAARIANNVARAREGKNEEAQP
ncbi:nickel pincer cofactor biosynthesis protein LarB [uncultured Methanomethylovorans sp.]|mgnify:FL=1|uniref:nickel pincer cofactor biosynthesis protein LarB n=2 Tax=Methanomethylovorans TaxID=101191 RepID=UPI00260AC2B2|nr:nickel pincer cofactor biosynthesis protein LarB [uncultured Methanomethylovorans sp.]